MEPTDGNNHYAEKLVRLPNLSIYYKPPQVRPIAMKREQLDFGLLQLRIGARSLYSNTYPISTKYTRVSHAKLAIVSLPLSNIREREKLRICS